MTREGGATSGRFMRVYVLGILLVLTPLVEAHTRSESFSHWWLTGSGATMNFQVTARDTTKLYRAHSRGWALDQVLLEHLRSHIEVQAQGKPCEPRAELDSLPAREGYLRVEWRFDCAGQMPDVLLISSFFDDFPYHVHFAQVLTEGAEPREHLVTATSQRLSVDAPMDSSSTSVLMRYLPLGIEHILLGVDHIVFLLALLLLCRRARDLVLLITGFTLGHSLSLSLATLGIMQPDIPTIEALIGFTIALVALEGIGVATGRTGVLANAAVLVLLILVAVKLLWGVGLATVTLLGAALLAWCHLSLAADKVLALRWRPLITAMFGVLHGFGFANTLLQIGLPQERFFPGLLGFNLGVELGQLLVVALLWAAVLLWRYTGERRRHAQLQEFVMIGLFGCGIFWFFARAYGA